LRDSAGFSPASLHTLRTAHTAVAHDASKHQGARLTPNGTTPGDLHYSERVFSGPVSFRRRLTGPDTGRRVV